MSQIVFSFENKQVKYKMKYMYHAEAMSVKMWQNVSYSIAWHDELSQRGM